jgi:predicted nuclease of predicted toxin-antitoxin system
MKLLLDQGLPRSTAALLRDGGHPALHVGELGMAAAADGAIIDYAQSNGLSIVTLDADFHALIAAAGRAGPSVIRLRVEGLRAREAAALICRVVERIGDRLRSGIFVTATMDTIRVRSLPIG